MYLEKPLIKSGMVEARDYQENIYKSCIGKNSLIVLPTGLGKSSVALRLIADKIFFGKCLMMAPTKPLVEQHVNYYRNLLTVDPDEIMLFTGSVSAAKRKEAWEKGRLILATPQTIQNDLEKGLYDLSKVSLVIFDEIHRMSGNYAYGAVADKYVEQNPTGQIVGMTASPGSDEEKVADMMEKIRVQNVISKKESDPDVAPYLHQKEITPHWFTLPYELSEVRERLQTLLASYIRAINEMGIEGVNLSPKRLSQKELNELKTLFQRLIAQNDPRGYQGVSLHAGIMKLRHGILVAESQGMLPLKKYIYSIYDKANTPGGSKADKRLAGDPLFKEIFSTTSNWEREGHPKLVHLPTMVLEELDENPESKIIIFASLRDSVAQIVSSLKEHGISATRFVGQSGSAKSADAGLSQKKQVQVLDKFRAGEFKVLVSTSVGEEGLDLPSVDCVIFYEPVPSDTRMIQRRGRTGRFGTGRVSVLITKDTVDEVYWNVSRKKEEKMRASL